MLNMLKITSHNHQKRVAEEMRKCRERIAEDENVPPTSREAKS